MSAHGGFCLTLPHPWRIRRLGFRQGPSRVPGDSSLTDVNAESSAGLKVRHGELAGRTVLVYGIAASSLLPCRRVILPCG
jgi:hypothetical protein